MEIDGSHGEGGGQVLRSALSLSCLTGTAFRMFNIRKGRDRPGLKAQHLMGVRAAALISGAEVSGGAQGSQEITFRPRRVEPGKYELDIGTAGSAPLVLQTVMPALLFARAELKIESYGFYPKGGGTILTEVSPSKGLMPLISEERCMLKK